MRMRRFETLLLSFVFLVCHAVMAQNTGTVPVTIVVSEISGGRVTHAQLRLVPSLDAQPKIETDDKGVASLSLKPGGYALFVQAQGFKSLATHIDVRDAQEPQSFPFVLELVPTASPLVAPASWNDALVLLTYPYHEPAAISRSELKAMPHITVAVKDSHSKADLSYSGVRLAEILKKMGAPLGKELRGEALTNYIIAIGTDGYEAVLALGEVDPDFHAGEVIVADGVNGKPLDAHNGPLKLVVSEDRRPARSVRNLRTIELRAP